MNQDQFKMKRRQSLSLEVDGVFDGLEEEEDTTLPRNVSMSECQMLRRILGSDKAEVLPRSCKVATTSQQRSFMSRLTHLGDTPDVAGRVSLSECHHLADTLKMVKGGVTFLPASCSGMLKKEQQAEELRFERENAAVYDRLKRKNSWVGKQDYPPSHT